MANRLRLSRVRAPASAAPRGAPARAAGRRAPPPAPPPKKLSQEEPPAKSSAASPRPASCTAAYSPDLPHITWLATTHHSFLGSFSAVSKRNFATKYAFFQVFRDLQNYLADFLKKLQNLQKIAKFCKTFAKFPDFRRKSADFCENR